jgi:hypothetical protein
VAVGEGLFGTCKTPIHDKFRSFSWGFGAPPEALDSGKGPKIHGNSSLSIGVHDYC